MSGAGTTSGTQATTGNANIDGILSGMKWTGGSISYSNPDSPYDYQVGYYGDYNDADTTNVIFDGFVQINSSQLDVLQFALDATRYGAFSPGGAGFAVEGFTNLSVSFAGSGSGAGTIRVANADDMTQSTAGYASYPGTIWKSGDVFINPFDPENVDGRPGKLGWHTILHEVGHALGLKHGDNPLEGPQLPAAVQSHEFSVMNYDSYVGSPWSAPVNDLYDYPQTFMQLDILALQTMYGANYSTNNGATTYTWNASDGTAYVNGQVAIDPANNGSFGNKIFSTIWDGGGTDLYDLSNFATNLNINLKPGEFSTFDSAKLALIGDDGSNTYARGNVANALLYNNNTGSLIENATGGTGNDTIHGNTANNTLIGGSGSDTLYGYEGLDRLYGGSGNNTLVGGTGDDSYYIDSATDIIVEVAGGGYDSVQTTVSYTLGSEQVEFLLGAGLAGLQLYGNSLGQRVQGGAGNDRISGGGGNDVLRGASGNDIFVFQDAASYSTTDTIEDFNTTADKIELWRSAYTTLNAGSTLNASAFRIGSAALDSDDRIYYNSGNGALMYDSDGNGAGTAYEIATLSPGLALTASHFIIA